jgi:hypothetical protein
MGLDGFQIGDDLVSIFGGRQAMEMGVECLSRTWQRIHGKIIYVN